MNRLEQRQRRRRNSVLDDKLNMEGVPSDAKSSVERAASDSSAAKDGKSAQDGPASIEGVPETGKNQR